MGDIEFLTTKEFAIPVGQVVLYMILVSIFFLLKKYRLGLLVSFIFVFNWGFLYGRTNFADVVGNPTLGFYIYLFFGLVMIVSVLVSFFHKGQHYKNLPLKSIADRCITFIGWRSS